MNSKEKPSGGIRVRAFCDKWGFSPATFYRGLKKGTMPRPVYVGDMPIIRNEAEQEWADKLKKQKEEKQADRASQNGG